MRTIELSHAPAQLRDVLTLASEENIIVRTPDGQEFVIAELDDFDKEIELIRQHEELMTFLKERSKEEGVYSLEEVREQLHSS